MSYIIEEYEEEHEEIYENNVIKNLNVDFDNEFFQKDPETRQSLLAGALQVFLRIRPNLSQDNEYELSIEEENKSLVVKSTMNRLFRFYYTRIFDEHSTQKDVYRHCLSENIKKFITSDYSYLLFTYGISNSGKTYTMQGNISNMGILPRFLATIFMALKDNLIGSHNSLQTNQNSTEDKTKENTDCDSKNLNATSNEDLFQLMAKDVDSELGLSPEHNQIIGNSSFYFTVSFLEIYNEQIFDLLTVSAANNVKSCGGIDHNSKGLGYKQKSLQNLRPVTRNMASSHRAQPYYYNCNNNKNSKKENSSKNSLLTGSSASESNLLWGANKSKLQQSSGFDENVSKLNTAGNSVIGGGQNSANTTSSVPSSMNSIHSVASNPYNNKNPFLTSVCGGGLAGNVGNSKNFKRRALPLGEDKEGNVYIKNLSEIYVASLSEVLAYLDKGKRNLKMASTMLNYNSSRSHSIFTIKLHRCIKNQPHQIINVNEFTREQFKFTLERFTSPLNNLNSAYVFCDLAGAERSVKTGNVGDRLFEARNINTSLLTLSKCLQIIKYNQLHKEKPKIIPFRESKLTRLFQNYFMQSHSQISMIVNISKLESMYSETLHSLKFSALAKKLILNNIRSLAQTNNLTRLTNLHGPLGGTLYNNNNNAVPSFKHLNSTNAKNALATRELIKDDKLKHDDDHLQTIGEEPDGAQIQYAYIKVNAEFIPKTTEQEDNILYDFQGNAYNLNEYLEECKKDLKALEEKHFNEEMKLRRDLSATFYEWYKTNLELSEQYHNKAIKRLTDGYESKIRTRDKCIKMYRTLNDRTEEMFGAPLLTIIMKQLDNFELTPNETKLYEWFTTNIKPILTQKVPIPEQTVLPALAPLMIEDKNENDNGHLLSLPKKDRNIKLGCNVYDTFSPFAIPKNKLISSTMMCSPPPAPHNDKYKDNNGLLAQIIESSEPDVTLGNNNYYDIGKDGGPNRSSTHKRKLQLRNSSEYPKHFANDVKETVVKKRSNSFGLHMVDNSPLSEQISTIAVKNTRKKSKKSVKTALVLNEDVDDEQNIEPRTPFINDQINSKDKTTTTPLKSANERDMTVFEKRAEAYNTNEDSVLSQSSTPNDQRNALNTTGEEFEPALNRLTRTGFRKKVFGNVWDINVQQQNNSANKNIITATTEKNQQNRLIKQNDSVKRIIAMRDPRKNQSPIILETPKDSPLPPMSPNVAKLVKSIPTGIVRQTKASLLRFIASPRSQRKSGEKGNYHSGCTPPVSPVTTNNITTKKIKPMPTTKKSIFVGNAKNSHAQLVDYTTSSEEKSAKAKTKTATLFDPYNLDDNDNDEVENEMEVNDYERFKKDGGNAYNYKKSFRRGPKRSTMGLGKMRRGRYNLRKNALGASYMKKGK